MAGLTVYPTMIKYVRNLNGGSTPSTLPITAKTTFVAGTKTAVNRIDLGNSTLTFWPAPPRSPTTSSSTAATCSTPAP